ncbi:MAG: hypothetical protein AB8B96_19160 [Lysobacterales bacterium]
MLKYLFVYHGGTHPENETEKASAMDAWGEWFGFLGSAVVDGGHPVGLSTTVSATDVVGNGGTNPVSGYSIVEASDLDDAVKKAQACPLITVHGGTVEVAEVVDM